MKGFGTSFKDPLNLILSLLVVLSLLGAWAYAKQTPGIDYYVAWVASDAVSSDTTLNVYDPASRFRLAVQYRNKADEQADAPRQKRVAQFLPELHMTATPFLYWVTATLATGEYEQDLDNWHLLSLVLLSVSIIVSCRLLGFSTATSLVLLLPVIVWFTPLHSDLRVANVNSFQVGIIGLILWLQSRDRNSWYLFAMAFTVGLLVMFKPNLAPVPVLLTGAWLIRRQFSKLLVGLSGMICAAITAVLMSSWWMGNPAAWIDWVKALGNTMRVVPGAQAGNYAAISEITQNLGSVTEADSFEKFISVGRLDPLTQLYLALALCLVCLVFFWWGRKRKIQTVSDDQNSRREFVENSLLIALGCFITMLTTGLVWSHYYLLTVPMFIFVFRPIPESSQMNAFMMITCLRVLPAIAFVCLLDTVIPHVLGFDGSQFINISTGASILILLTVGLWQLAYGIRDRLDRGVA